MLAAPGSSDRVNAQRRRGALQCFGTSATLGRGAADYPELVQFAEALFDEPFVWDPNDPDRQDVVGAERKQLVRGAADGSPQTPSSCAALRALRSQWRKRRRAGRDRRRAARRAEPGRRAHRSRCPATSESLSCSHVLSAVRSTLSGPLDELFDGPDAAERLVDLVDLGVLARHREDDAPLIPARYHFFLRALEGAFLCLHPEHPAGDPSLLLSPPRALPRVRPKRPRRNHGGARHLPALRRRIRHRQAHRGRATTSTRACAARWPSDQLRLLIGEAVDVGEDDEDEDFGIRPK